MSPEVSPNDFGDEQIVNFFDQVESLRCEAVEPVPPDVADEAERFAAMKPRPSPSEFRTHLAHTVTVARGWDDPDDPQVMFHTAVKSYYVYRWLEHLQSQAADRHVDLAAAARISFSPQFRGGRPPV